MLSITALQQTYLKKTTDQSSLLGDEQKHFVPQGKRYEVKERRDRTDNHVLLTLAWGQGDWFAWGPHWQFDQSTQQDNVTDAQYIYPPTMYSDGRKSICAIAPDFIQDSLSETDYTALAKEFGLNLPVVKAVIEVESLGSGFLLQEPSPSRPKILFEAHQFYKRTPKPVSKTRPDLSTRYWSNAKRYYLGGSSEWQRLIDAMSFDEKPAIESASWGLGQVMGFNYRVAGCETQEQFVEENFSSEYHQARHMLNFIQKNNLTWYLKTRNWDGFAYRYNGSGYKTNRYDVKLAQAYQKFGGA